MESLQSRELGFAQTDYADRLLKADGLLGRLNVECGGRIGATLAIPELLDIVVKAREYDQCLSRQFTAIDKDQRVSAWVEVQPRRHGEAGCSIKTLAWHVEDLLCERHVRAGSRRGEILAQLSDLTIQIDQFQRIIAVDNAGSEFDGIAKRLRENLGQIWTRFICLPTSPEEMNEAAKKAESFSCRFPDTTEEWTVWIEGTDDEDPLGETTTIHFFARQSRVAQPAIPAGTPSLGRDLTPVLRQPINRIIANAETMRTQLAGPLAAEYSDYAADIASAGQHLLGLMDDLSDLAVIESDGFTTVPDRIDLGDVARRACGILRVRARERGIELEPPPEGESQRAIAEFRRVLQVLLNLIGNAIRYAPEDSRVWVRLDAADGLALVTVADQGFGLTAEEQVRIFEKYERLGHDGDGGTGLGLYISRRIARAMHGDLTVESAPGQGARFILAVPGGD
ncbi:MAG: sensor histidine kinase [Erythrobacter sp.]|nr:sensor histidine kinase [Erythrobacter sp.]